MSIRKIIKIGFLIICSIWFTPTHAKEFKLIFQTSEPADSLNFNYLNEWAEKLTKDSNGQIQINLLPVGSAVKHTETLDAVGAGILDGHITDTSYFSGKDPAFGLIANPIGAYSSPDEMLDFMYNHGGNQLMREMLQPYNLYFIGAASLGFESLVSNVPLKQLKDLKGLSIRTPEGLVKDVFSALGSKAIVMPSSKVLTAFDKDKIDVADYGIFANNYSQNMYRSAKYSVYPGFHSMPLLEISMNAQKWHALPDAFKTLFSQSVKDYAQSMRKNIIKQNQKAIKASKKQSVVVYDWSNQERQKFRSIALKELEKFSKKSRNAKKVYAALSDYLNQKNDQTKK